MTLEEIASLTAIIAIINTSHSEKSMNKTLVGTDKSSVAVVRGLL